MQMKFCKFALCNNNNNWKAKANPTKYYPSWYKGCKLTGELIKQEDTSCSLSMSPMPVATEKHTLPLEVCHSQKKAKVGNKNMQPKTEPKVRFNSFTFNSRLQRLQLSAPLYMHLTQYDHIH